MADWKSALRQIKTSLSGKKEAQESREPASRWSTQPPHEAKTLVQNARLLAKAGSPAISKILAVPHTAPSKPFAPSMRPALVPASVSSTPGPMLEALPKPKGIPTTVHVALASTLARQAYFKMPERWVVEGARTQLVPGNDNTAVDVVIGLDFGTSYTKAAIGLRDQIIPVTWEGVSDMPERYLLPSEYSVLDDGSCQLGQAPSVSHEKVRQRLKHPFIDPAVSSASIVAASIFVALVLRYIRAWIFHRHGNKIGRSKVRWILNIGAPSNGLENARLERAYRRLGASAWILSQTEADIDTEIARQVTDQASIDQLPDELIDLCVRPEFVAQIAGYVQSAQRRPGLHALVDVGGGTLDVVTFIVHERDGEDVFPFLVPEVRALGTQLLDANRLVDASKLGEIHPWDGLAPVLCAAEFARTNALPEDYVCLRDGIFWEAVRDVVKGVLHKTKVRRYRLSSAWTDGLPTFFTGGGATIDGYRKSVKEGGECHAKVVNLMPLPFHPRLAEFTGGLEEYQRISVACGLALDAFALGHIRPAREVEDDLAPRQPVLERPGHEELYAR